MNKITKDIQISKALWIKIYNFIKNQWMKDVLVRDYYDNVMQKD